jgi:hypothetical protein
VRSVIISLIVVMSWLVTDRHRYVRGVAMSDTITYQALERTNSFEIVDALGHIKVLMGYCKP